MKLKSLVAQKSVSKVIMLIPLGFFLTLVYEKLVPWWTPLGYYALSVVCLAYYHFIRVPFMQKEAVFRAMFGFIKCPHGKYLPDDPCAPCSDKWVAENAPQLMADVRSKTPDGETLH